MSHPTLNEYLKSQYTSPRSGIISSYIKAIKIIDELFNEKDTLIFISCLLAKSGILS